MLEFEHVTTKGKGFQLQDISFRLEDGFIMALAGENGAGKTTLLKHILEPGICYNGRILIDGIDIRRDRNACLNRTAYVSDDYAMPWGYRVYQVCELYKPFYDNWNQGVLEKYLSVLEVPVGEIMENLSRGEFFRMQIALGLAHGATLFLMDEVTGGMDPVFRRELWRLLRKITIPGCNVLLVTHLMDEIQQKCDYHAILENGCLVQWKEAELK